MPEPYPIRKVVKIVGVERETFKTWKHRGYIRSSVYQAAGPGEQNLYNRNDLDDIKLFMKLIEIGFSRPEASLKVRSFRDALDDDDSDTILVAFIKRPVGKDKMFRKAGAHITDDGRLVSNKALAPGIRILNSTDLEKSFKTLFLTLDDTDIPGKFDMQQVELDSVSIVDFGRIKREVDLAIKAFG